MEIEIPVKDLAYWDEATHTWKIEKLVIHFISELHLKTAIFRK